MEQKSETEQSGAAQGGAEQVTSEQRVTATDELSSEEWVEAARQCLELPKDDELRLVQVKGKTDSTDNDMEGFLGETLRVRVRVARAEAPGEQREAALFLKTVPQGNRVREALALETRAFHKEQGFFELLARLSPRLPRPLRPWAARCFVARPRLLLFEDLAVHGFRTLGLRNTLDFAHCAAALDAVARMHATSLALEEVDLRTRRINPWRLGDRFPDPLQEVMFTDTFLNILSKYIVVGLNPMKTIIRLMPKYRDSPRLDEILQKVDRIPKIANEAVKPSKKYRNVLCHGDIWVNNLMFRDSTWGQVAEARLVDFQLTRYAPPALDVEMLLHLCMRRGLRDKHAHELRASYYEALDKALGTLGFRAQDLIPRKEFDESCSLGAAFGRIVTASYFPGDMLPNDIIRPVMDSVEPLERYLLEERCSYVRDAWARDEEYRERLSEIMEELVDNLLLAKDGFV